MFVRDSASWGMSYLSLCVGAGVRGRGWLFPDSVMRVGQDFLVFSLLFSREAGAFGYRHAKRW